ncbi:hypothetical protein [Streptomyces sp. NPDC006335]|uniref:hypothetical protein n=1 Tax=Streptomyces sp. NPDC006335 TaxID=3156895 RepID=UPI0033BE84C2
MPSTARPRFSARIGLAEPIDDGPYDGVPRHLVAPLQEWVQGELESIPYRGDDYDEVERTICLRLRLDPTHGYDQALTNATDADLLDVVDALLAYRVERRITAPKHLSRLDSILNEGGSAYRISDSLDGLEERVTPAVRNAIRQTVADAGTTATTGSAADHLSAAWQNAYGRQPDPVRAYSEAIKAVESAAHSVVEPRNNKATLGSMLGELRTARHKFGTALVTAPGKDPVLPVEEMMRALWEGQTSRHGAQTATVPETLDAARAATHIAATLVQLFVSGAVTRSS